MGSLGNKLFVVGSQGLGSLLSSFSSLLDQDLSSELLWSQKSLDLWTLLNLLLTNLLGVLNDELSDIVVLGQVEELSNLGGSLWTKGSWVAGIGDAREFLLTLLDNDQVKDGQVGTDDATSDGLSSSLTVSTSPLLVTSVASSQEKSGSGVDQDTLLHWETLSVLAAGNLEDVSLEFVTDRVTADFLGHSLVEETSQLVFIIDFDGLGATSNWVRNQKLRKKRFNGNEIMLITCCSLGASD